MGTPVSGTGSPASFRALGIPAPLIKPTVGHSGGTGSAVSRSYVYTFMSDWNEESGPSPASDLNAGKIDDTWAISGMDAAPPNTGSIIGAVHSSGVVTVQTSVDGSVADPDADAERYSRVGAACRLRLSDSTPANTNDEPMTCMMETASPRNIHATPIVDAGPMDSMSEVRADPIIGIPEDSMKTGNTV